MKKFAKIFVSFVVVAAMMCSMLGAFAYGTNTVRGSLLKVELIDTDGVTVLDTWIDPATTATGSDSIYVTPAQMLRITASLQTAGDITVFSYADGTEESALTDSNIQYVGQEEDGTVITVRPRATLEYGKYLMYVGGDNVLTPYSFSYYVGEAKDPLGIENISNRVPNAAAAGGAAVTYKITSEITAATDITDVTFNGESIKDKCTVSYNEAGQYWQLAIADVGYTYEIGTYSALVSANGYSDATIQFTVYDVVNYVDSSDNILYTGEIVDNAVTLKPGTAANGAKVATVDKYFESWSYNGAEYSVEDGNANGYTTIPVVDGQRTAVLNEATVSDGYADGSIISKAGAQWVKYTVQGDSTEYDGIRVLSLIDFDGKLNGETVVDYTDLTKVSDTELANKSLTSGVGTVSWTNGTSSNPGTATMTVDDANNSMKVEVGSGNYHSGTLYFRPSTVKTDAVKSVMTAKIKPYLLNTDGTANTTSNSSTQLNFAAIGVNSSGTEVSQRSAQYCFAGGWSRGAGAGGSYPSNSMLSTPVVGDDGYYSFKFVSTTNSSGTQISYIYDMNNDGATIFYHSFGTSATNRAETLGHGFSISYNRSSVHTSTTIGMDIKDIEMHYEYDGVATIDHVGVVVANTAEAPTIEAGFNKTARRTVYETIRARQGNTVTTMSVADVKDTAQAADSENRRFADSLDTIYYAILQIPEARKDQKVYATPYVQFSDGTRIYGSAIVGTDGNPGVTYNELKAADPGTSEPELSVLESGDEASSTVTWKSEWTTSLGLGQ